MKLTLPEIVALLVLALSVPFVVVAQQVCGAACSLEVDALLAWQQQQTPVTAGGGEEPAINLAASIDPQ